MLSFYQTDKTFIVTENKRIFNIEVCSTCHSQLVAGYQRIKTYNDNNDIMAKKKVETAEIKKSGFVLKKEYEGAVYSNGITAIHFSAIDLKDVKNIFSEKEIKEYFNEIL